MNFPSSLIALRYAWFFLCFLFIFWIDFLATNLDITGHLQPYFFQFFVAFGVLYRPDLIRTSHLFIVGLLQDSLYGYPLGFTFLTCLAPLLILLYQKPRLIKSSFIAHWLAFGLFVFISLISHEIGLFYLYNILFSFKAPLLNGIFSCFIYPICHVGFLKLASLFPFEKNSH